MKKFFHLQLSMLFYLLKTSISTLTIKIVNILGQVVLKERFSNIENQFNAQFDVNKFPSGSYIIHLSEQDKDGTIGQISRQIVIQR